MVRPAEEGEKAVMELYDASTRRVTGKQPWMTPMMFGGRLESQIRGRMCSVWAILLMSSLTNFMETNLMMEIKTEVWMWNLPFVQCGQGGSPTPLQRLLQRPWWIQTLQTPLWRQLQRHFRLRSVHVRAVGLCSLMGRIATFALVLHQGRGPHSRA